ncbi:MAG TPA: LacI family DNA-binding transcriptional regulator [Clostridia bacterium]|nr:LacI family DNA-binding transcriptional regulator [Clostridia bacterium]
MKRNRRSITIQDVAKAAGVSVSTVSRVLNDKVDVAVETYEKVQKVILELGYASSLAARGMRSHRTNVIGAIIPDVISPYCIEVLRGVNQTIAQLDYDLLIYTNGDIQRTGTDEHERQYVNFLNGSITDGVIVIAAAATSFLTDAPLVIVDPNVEIPVYPAIISTNYEGALEVMRYLIGLGHCRIAHITGRLGLLSARQRLQGYRDGLAEAGIPIDPQLIQISDYTIDTAAECARRLLTLKDPPTAIFAANDMSAMGVYQAAKEAGVRIPENLSVVGFDNIREASFLNPALTTVDQSIMEMGVIATEMVLKLVEGETLESDQVKIQTRLVVRDSCRPLH